MPIGYHPSVPFITDLSGGPSKDGAAIVLRFGLSDGRKFSGALPLGTIDAVLGRIESYVMQAAERIQESESKS